MIDERLAKLWSAAVLPDKAQDLIDYIVAGGDVNVNDRGRPLMYVIAGGGQPRLAKLALEHGADPNSVDGISGESALHAAARGRHAGVVAALLAYGADVNVRDRHGSTPAFNALSPHPPVSIEVVDMLVQAGSDLDRKNNFGVSARDLARDSTNPDVSKYV
jgi:ankyrin repeat protein